MNTGKEMIELGPETKASTEENIPVCPQLIQQLVSDAADQAVVQTQIQTDYDFFAQLSHKNFTKTLPLRVTPRQQAMLDFHLGKKVGIADRTALFRMLLDAYLRQAFKKIHGIDADELLPKDSIDNSQAL